jgi:hypothetical protein
MYNNKRVCCAALKIYVKVISTSAMHSWELLIDQCTCKKPLSSCQKHNPAIWRHYDTGSSSFNPVYKYTTYVYKGLVPEEFSLLQIGSEVHPTSYPMGTGGSFPGVKWLGREVDHSPPK